MLTRRAFAGGMTGLAFLGPLGGTARAQASASLEPALAAIRAYAGAHKAMFNLPGMTIGLTAPGGFATSFDVGVASFDGPRAIGPDTLFQIGSISKLITALLVHQFAAEGRFALTDPISRLLPTVPVPASAGITVQQLLDHRSGLPGDAPVFPDGGLWVGYEPGTHWSYSNTGYEILGKLVEQAGKKPLARLVEERVLGPLGMARSRGDIVAADRTRFAQGYEAANNAVPYARGVPLAPAAWVDVTFGAGNVASTAVDMNKLTAALAAALRGGTLPGLSAAQTAAYLAHAAPTDSAAMRYGNGLMHVSSGERRYLHHTGGMVSFSSAFHLDRASGVAAFASTTLTGLAGYRPSGLTRFAVDALTEAMAGRPLPSPPKLDDRVSDAPAYTGIYSGPAGNFEVLPGGPLTISSGGRSAALQPLGNNLFRTTHPDFARYTLMFERTGARVTGASWGPSQYAKRGAAGARGAPSDPALARLAGRFVNDSPWWGVLEIVERGGRLWLGTETPLVALGNEWRIGDDKRSPERGRFSDPIDGRPQTFYFSGEKFVRHDI